MRSRGTVGLKPQRHERVLQRGQAEEILRRLGYQKTAQRCEHRSNGSGKRNLWPSENAENQKHREGWRSSHPAHESRGECAHAAKEFSSYPLTENLVS